jgi:hypothetical protein
MRRRHIATNTAREMALTIFRVGKMPPRAPANLCAAPE